MREFIMDRHKKKSGRKRLNYKGISGVLAMIATVCMIGSMTKGYFIAQKINKIEVKIEQKEKDKIKIQEEMKLIQEDTTLLEKEIDGLTTALWNYQPIRIPDSMK